MKRYGLLGYPLTHSFSKRYFTEKFETENIESTYQNFEIDSITKFPEILENNPEIIGLNVTIPYKEQVIPYLDELNDSAREIKAVNTIRVTRTESGVHLKGFNTDTFGFESTLTPLLKEQHKKALILGTGGASKALKYVLNKLGIDYVSASIEELKEKEIRYEDIDEKMIAERLLIINATPLGTYPKVDTFPNIPYEFIGKDHLLFDLVYNPEVTQFMAKGMANGAVAKNGYDIAAGTSKQSLRNLEFEGVSTWPKPKYFLCAWATFCRSPSAEAVFTGLVKNNGLAKQFEIDSAGTNCLPRRTTCRQKNAVACLKTRFQFNQYFASF